MGFLSKKEAMAAVTTPAPENTMVIIKPNGHGSADVSVADVEVVPQLYFYTKGVVVPNQSVWYDISTGDQFRANQFGHFEGFNGNSRVISPSEPESRFLCHEDAYTNMQPSELTAILDSICRPTRSDWLTWIAKSQTAKMNPMQVRAVAVTLGIKLIFDDIDQIVGIDSTWESFFKWAAHIEDFITQKQYPKAEAKMTPEQVDRLEKIYEWAKQNKIDSTTVFAHWGPIQKELGCTDDSLTVLDGRMRVIALERSKKQQAKAEKAEKEVFGTPATAVANGSQNSNVLAVGGVSADVSTAMAPPSKDATASPVSAELTVIPINTETGEIEMPVEEVCHLLQIQKSEIEKYDATDLANVNKLLSACVTLQHQCMVIATMATSEINARLSLMALLLYKYGGSLREFTLPQLKGKSKTWKSPNLLGSVHFKKTGGLKCANKAELKRWAQALSDEDLAKYPFLKVDVVIDQKAANTWQKEHPDTLLPGYEDVPVHELGIMQVGDGKPWSLPKLKTALKSIKISNLTSYLESDDDEEEE